MLPLLVVVLFTALVAAFCTAEKAEVSVDDRMNDHVLARLLLEL